MQAYLVPPGPILISRLDEPGEPSISPIDRRGLISAEQILPVPRRALIFLCIGRLVQTAGHLRNGEIIVGVFKSTRDTAGNRSKSKIIKVFDWDVVQRFPADESTPALDRPGKRFFLCIFLNCQVSCVPVDIVGDALDECVGKDDVCIGAALGEAYRLLEQAFGKVNGCLPLQRDIRQSGSQPRCRCVSMSERIMRDSAVGSKIVRNGN